MQLEKLLKQPSALPAAPKVVRRLITTFDQEEVDMLQVAALIEEDPVLTAKMLKTANSAFFGLTRSVSTAREAVNVMGLIKVRALVIAAAFGEGFHSVGSVNMNQFWRYSMNSANLARYIALPIRIDESTAFTSGLIHNIGELVMHVGMPEAMIDLERSVPMLDLKRATRRARPVWLQLRRGGRRAGPRMAFPQAHDQRHRTPVLHRSKTRSTSRSPAWCTSPPGAPVPRSSTCAARC